MYRCIKYGGTGLNACARNYISAKPVDCSNFVLDLYLMVMAIALRQWMATGIFLAPKF